MERIWRTVPAAVLFFCLAGTVPVVAAEQQEQQKVEKPYSDVRVLVRAFVVDVKLAALDKAGAGPFEKEAPSATEILDILKSKEGGRIRATATLAVRNKENGETRASNKTDVPVYDGKDPNGQVRTKMWSYETGTTFDVYVSVTPDGVILVGYNLATTILEKRRDEFATPETPRYTWKSQVSLRSGVPAIAAALEEKDAMTYLILRADIEKDSLPEKKK